MKLKNLDQELEFIRSAEPKQLVAYVVNNRFSARAEKQLIKRGITEASLFYIKAYGLKEPAQVEVFRANRPQLVDAVLESAADPCRTIALLLTHGEYNTVMKYLSIPSGISSGAAVKRPSSATSTATGFPCSPNTT